MAKGWTDKRPMSPHMTIWKWHPTMLSSILHRATGIILYFTLLVLCICLAFLAAGPAGFEKVKAILFTPFGAFLFFAFIGIIKYHLFNGVRHLLWDAGKGFDPKLSNTISILTIVAATAVAALLTYILVGSLK